MIGCGHGPLELDAVAMRALLAELDERVRERGVAASDYVVGRAAMALAIGRWAREFASSLRERNQ